MAKPESVGSGPTTSPGVAMKIAASSAGACPRRRTSKQARDWPPGCWTAKLVADEILNQLDWCNEMLLVGTGAAARPRIEALDKALATLPRDDDWRRQGDEALEVYTCGDQNKELKASAEMLDLQAELFLSGPSAALAKSLQKTARAHPGTHAAERAAFLASIAAP